MQQAFHWMQTAITSRQNRPLVWTVLLTTLIGFLGLLSPVDDAMRTMRNHLHSHSTSGAIVVVNMDDATTAANGEWPWPRHRIAELVRQMDRAGARQIAFEHYFAPSSDVAGTRDLADAFADLPTRPVIGAMTSSTSASANGPLPKPDEQLAPHAIIASPNLYFDPFGRAWQASNRAHGLDPDVPTLAGVLAGLQSTANHTYYIDYSLDPTSVVQVSAADVMAGRLGSLLRDKTVLVSTAPTTASVPGGDPRKIALVQVLAAETMMSGQQIDLGWALPSLVGLIGAILIWRRRRFGVVRFAVLTMMFSVFPVWLEAHGIYGFYAQGLVLVVATAVVRFWQNQRLGGERTNPLSGLPNLTALREYELAPGDTVVAVRVRNYPQLAAMFSKHEEVLARQIVQRLTAVSVVPLFHGDEGIFCWITPELAPDDLAQHLDALHSLFHVPLDVEGLPVDITIAFGVESSTSLNPSMRFASALIAADEAGAAGLRWKSYDPARLDRAEWDISLLGRLDAAIETGEVWVAFQPKYDLQRSCVTGVEALARWTHPERGMISPDEFIPAAETNGRIDKLTYFVLEQSLALASEMGGSFNIAVNLSAQMFGRRDFVTRVGEMLKHYDVPATNLTLEVTESAAAQNEHEMRLTINGLIDLGVAISIDDYGTGYSSLEYLKTLRASELKIDRSFVSAMERNSSDKLLVDATIKLAHSLGHSVVAEGVETKETLDILCAMGCDKAQGYFISRPVARTDFLKFMKGKPACAAA